MVADQESVVREFKSQGMMTARLLYNMVSVMSKATAQGLVAGTKLAKNTLAELPGEKRHLKTLSKSGVPLDYTKLSNNELNLDKLKIYLKQYGVQFHAEKLKDGSFNYWFKSKDEKKFQAAVEQLKNDIVGHKKEIKNLEKKANDLTPQQQINKHKAKAPKTQGVKAKMPTKSV